MQQLRAMLKIFSHKPRSRITVGFHRVGIVLAAPFLTIAIVAAALQWLNPTGSLVADVPEGARAFKPDEIDDAAQQIVAEQRSAGFNLPSQWLLVGLPLGVVHYKEADWTKFQLPDGREIAVASTDEKKVSDVAFQFLLIEKRTGRPFRYDDPIIRVEGVAVAFLNRSNADPSAPPWHHRNVRDWTWALLALLIGFACYLAMRAVGWIINGFSRGIAAR
jgi:hypothetical protein